MVKTTLNINGMKCKMCEAHVNELIKENYNIKKVESSAKENKTVVISEKELDIEALKGQIADIGFTLESSDSEPYKKGLFAKS
ncbi:MAG: heavy-metal-associated domain-containing protein [Ruminococcus sp.]|nr:heavy-metal-associated domain-containing protein [Ruminococcus sp.]